LFPASRSFFTLFCGVPREAVPADYSTHHIIVEDWDRMEQDEGTLYVSIPSVLDPTIAPADSHNLHMFTVERRDGWRYGNGYRDRKGRVAEPLIARLKENLPLLADPHFHISATPLTNERFLARKDGSYGPLFSGGKDLLFRPKNLTPIKNLYCVGDS